MEESIIDLFGEPKTPLNELSPLTLAFLGDAVHSLVAANVAVNRGNTAASKLHERTEKYVSARAQARTAEYLLENRLLSDEEEAIYRRGVNAKPKNKAKNATFTQYHKATGFEALLGYLYKLGQHERIAALVYEGVRLIDGKDDPAPSLQQPDARETEII